MKRDTNQFDLMSDFFSLARAANPKHKADLGFFHAWAPTKQVGIDIIGGATFPKSRTSFKYILSIIDHFTKWAVAVPMKDHTTETIAQGVLYHWVTIFGVPIRIHSDRGVMLESEGFHALCRLLRIHKSQTTPYGPQSDGTTEICYRNVKDMLAQTANHHPEELDM